MKLLHTADLHIGKSVSEFFMKKDQEYILEQIIDIAGEEEVDAVLLAGDIYDRAAPASEAVVVFDRFLKELAEKEIPVFAISGNHDSPERISFGNTILKKQGIYLEGTFSGKTAYTDLTDEFGTVRIHMLPFLRPQTIRYALPEAAAGEAQAGGEVQPEDSESRSYEKQLRILLEKTEFAADSRNILMTHYFVTDGGRAPETSDSEQQLTVGGVDNIDVSVFEGFDYVALGHIHGPQSVGRNTVCYSGSPLKYSFSECFQEKSVTIVELGEKGNTAVRRRPLAALHDMRRLRGCLEQLIQKEIVEQGDPEDYLQVTLTDSLELADPIGTLRAVYPNVMQLILEKNHGTVQDGLSALRDKNRVKEPLELFKEFYEEVSGNPLDEEREKVLADVIAGLSMGREYL